MKINLLFIASPREVVPILEEITKADFVADILVITKPPAPAGRGRELRDTPVKTKAEAMGLKVLCPDNLKDKKLLENIKNFSPHIGLCAAYGKIIPPELLKIPQKGILNIHPSLLPRWRGAAPVQRALEAGDKVTGVSFALMTEGLDDGPVVYAEKKEIGEKENAVELMENLMKTAAEVVDRVLWDYLKGSITPKPQEGEITYARKITKEEGKINWNMRAIEIYNKIRAFYPWPGTYTFLKDKLLKIHKANVLNRNTENYPGTIVDVSNHGIEVQCRDGILNILELQLEGKKKIGADEFIRGYKIEEGTRLG